VTLIVGAILVGAGIGAAWVKYPDDWLTAPLILLSGLLVWRVRRTLEPHRLFWMLVASHVVLVLLVGRSLHWHLPLMLVLAGIPAGLIVLHRRWHLFSSGGLVLSLLLCVAGDLGYYALRVSSTVHVVRPDRLLGFLAKPQEPTFRARGCFLRHVSALQVHQRARTLTSRPFMGNR